MELPSYSDSAVYIVNQSNVFSCTWIIGTCGVYLQHLESTKIFYILRNQQLIGHFRYVDDILIIYKDNLTNIQETLRLFNNISRMLTFTMEKETNNSINFLDITIQKQTITSPIAYIGNRHLLILSFPVIHVIQMNTKWQLLGSWLTVSSHTQ